MGCDVDPNKIPARQPENDEDIEQVKANGWGNKQVHSGNVRCVVTQEGCAIPGTADRIA
jgi:hypothetical protein